MCASSGNLRHRGIEVKLTLQLSYASHGFVLLNDMMVIVWLKTLRMYIATAKQCGYLHVNMLLVMKYKSSDDSPDFVIHHRMLCGNDLDYRKCQQAETR